MQIVSGAMLGFSRRPRDLPAEILGWEFAPAPSPEEAIELAARMLVRSPPRWERVRPFVRFDAGGYARTILFRARRWELVVAGWLPGQRSAVHDHGLSSGAVLAIHGALLERRFLRRAEGVSPGETRTIREGDVIVEHPGTVHQVVNDSPRPAATLHIYSPVLRRMGIYEERG